MYFLKSCFNAIKFTTLKFRYPSSSEVSIIQIDEVLLSKFRKSLTLDEGDSIITPSKRKEEETLSDTSPSDAEINSRSVAPAAEDDVKPFEPEFETSECASPAVVTKLPRIGRSLRSRSRPRAKE